MKIIFYISLLFLILNHSLFSQYTSTLYNNKPYIKFNANSNKILSIDEAKYKEWDTLYQSSSPLSHHVSHLSLDYSENPIVFGTIRNIKKINKKLLVAFTDSVENIYLNWINDSTYKFQCPRYNEHFSIYFEYRNRIISELNIHVFSIINEKLIIVPLVDFQIDKIKLTQELNKIFKPANLNFSVEIRPKFIDKQFNSELSFNNPSSKGINLTHQMRRFRDLYFSKNLNETKNANFIFIVPNFVNKELNGYMPKNKAIGFVSSKSDFIYHQIPQTIACGLGLDQNIFENRTPESSSTFNLMDTTKGIELSYFQWEFLRTGAESYQFYDEEEDVKTNNGMIAYYFWEQNEKGEIIIKTNILNSIHRPFKKNYTSYHLNIDDILLKPFYTFRSIHVCSIHIILFIVTITAIIYIRRKLKRNLRKIVIRPFFLTRILLMGIVVFGLVLFGISWAIINKQIERYEVISGFLKDLHGQDYFQAYHSILNNKNLKHQNQFTIGSEILINKGENWYMKKKKNVLYFNVNTDSKKIFQLAYDSDSLKIDDYNEKAYSHFMVFNYLDSTKKIKYQRVFNHSGNDITDKLFLKEDPAKRILVFVNGYRPTSLGRTFEDNFDDIMKKGLEYPNSLNMIYGFDRYNYWRPWNKIDVTFQKRINPTEVFYADGHFSVETSNYKSLIKFSTAAENYPKRCNNPKKHHCFKTKKDQSFWSFLSSDKTTDLLPGKANRKGFKTRWVNGKIAGKNLLQVLNEIPNKSENDTLIIVAHSMGFAYAQGLIESVKHKINLGEYYIIAPENAESGNVEFRNWKTVFQYGCNNGYFFHHAPCMLDGIAPQSKVSGLPKKNRIFIPKQYYNRFGFFDSHFIGYYTWIFDLKKNENGCILQR